jgi:DDE superfamily endonuclease
VADLAHGQRPCVLYSSQTLRQGSGGRHHTRRILLVLDQAGWHTGKEVEVPEGISLEFLPSASPELQPSERVWPLSNEGVANRFFEEIEELEEALGERCVALSVRPTRTHTLAHPLPLVAQGSMITKAIQTDLVLSPQNLVSLATWAGLALEGSTAKAFRLISNIGKLRKISTDFIRPAVSITCQSRWRP